jgi:hypothetical protein
MLVLTLFLIVTPYFSPSYLSHTQTHFEGRQKFGDNISLHVRYVAEHFQSIPQTRDSVMNANAMFAASVTAVVTTFLTKKIGGSK